MNIHQINNKTTYLSSLISTTKSARRGKRSGFALISTITIMSLLMILAVSILGLSSVEVRSSKIGSYRDQAEANARVALMEAIGQLQQLSGPDTRVTASSRMFDENNVAVTGVWRSWEGMTLDSAGRPIAPDYNLKEDTGDPNDLPAAANGEGRFLGWLGSTKNTPDVNDLSYFSKTASDDYVKVLGDGSVGSSDDHVYVKPTFIDNSAGTIAWWTSGNNSKAMINARGDDNPNSVVEWQERLRANGRADAETFGVAKINERPVGALVPSVNSLELVEATAEIRKFHDMTTFSRGLLTNTARGGWKRDFSLLSEQYASLPMSDLPSLMLQPGEVQTFSKAVANNQGHLDNPLIYPWSTYRSLNNAAWGQAPPICSWSAMVDYALQYKKLTTNSATNTAMTTHLDGLGRNDRSGFLDQVRRVPVMARIQWVFSLCSRTDPADNTKYNPGLMLTPVVTFWNPYNVELSVGKYDINIKRNGIVPLRFAFTVDGTDYSLTTLPQICGGDMSLKLSSGLTLKPGASKTFSIAGNVEVEGNNRNVPISEGYTPGGGFRFYRINQGNTVSTSGSSSYSIREVSYSANNSKLGIFGVWYDMSIIDSSGAASGVAHRMGYREAELAGGEAGIVETLYPSLTERLSVNNVSSLDEAQPFASAIFGYRFATPLSTESKHNHLYSKGLLMTNPLQYYSELGKEDNGATPTSMAGSGTFHPINSAYDFAFLDVNGWNEDFMPQVDPSSNAGYIVSGLQPSNGLTRCVIAELPTRPLQSLAQLQHFDARNNNPVPPFQYNMIGNGSAHPLFDPSEVFVSTIVNSGMINDDTYLLNHMLFDDWFISSIAPDLDDFTAIVDRGFEQVYEEHVNGLESLPNHFYQPSDGADINDVSSSIDLATNRYTYATIASKLEVDGMFNINSVSVDAWKAILKHGRNTDVPYIGSNGVTQTASSSGRFPYPRTSIAGDESTSSGSVQSNPLNGDAAQFAGYNAMTNDQIDALAVEIVSEIRKRGPFLSLSEFVNRRLTSDKDLAIAGAIQKALDNLASMGASAKNPFAEIQKNAYEITTYPYGDPEYQFPEASLGSSAFGAPGWVRQADILAPIAPIITVRDDSFTIRAYGDVRNPSDSSEILAKAWCEATVKRTADYLDPIDSLEVIPYSTQMVSDINEKYGRRYVIVSFRWLNEEEI